MNLVGDSLLGMISAVKPHTERYVPLDTTLSIERTNHAINVLTSNFEKKISSPQNYSQSLMLTDCNICPIDLAPSYFEKSEVVPAIRWSDTELLGRV